MARTVSITAHPNVPGGRFCRAGRCFGTVAEPMLETDFTPEQLKILEAEPMLVVEFGPDQTSAEKKPAKPEQPKEVAPAKPVASKAEAPAKPEPDKKVAKGKAAEAAAAPADPEAKPKDEANPQTEPNHQEGGK